MHLSLFWSQLCFPLIPYTSCSWMLRQVAQPRLQRPQHLIQTLQPPIHLPLPPQNRHVNVSKLPKHLIYTQYTTTTSPGTVTKTSPVNTTTFYINITTTVPPTTTTTKPPCSERGRSENFKMKIYVSSGIWTHATPPHDRRISALDRSATLVGYQVEYV